MAEEKPRAGSRGPGARRSGVIVPHESADKTDHDDLRSHFSGFCTIAGSVSFRGQPSCGCRLVARVGWDRITTC